ncbi:MAG: hypothetical protein ABIQ53_14520, partial [Terracoccus sp.]
GVSALITPPSPTYFLLAHWAGARACVWIVTGLIAIAYARRRQGADAPGFLALYLMAAYRVAAYSLGFIHWLLPGDGGDARGIVGVFAWTTVVILIIAISGWAEPNDLDHPRDNGSDR